MAEVVVAMPAGGAAGLPVVCVACGRPGAWGRRVRVLSESSGYARMVGEFALDNLERTARGPGAIRLPVCWWHRWVVPPAVTAAARGGRVRLSGVSAEFAATLGLRGIPSASEDVAPPGTNACRSTALAAVPNQRSA